MNIYLWKKRFTLDPGFPKKTIYYSCSQSFSALSINWHILVFYQVMARMKKIISYSLFKAQPTQKKTEFEFWHKEHIWQTNCNEFNFTVCPNLPLLNLKLLVNFSVTHFDFAYFLLYILKSKKPNNKHHIQSVLRL